MAVIRWDHSTGRREASASRKLGVVFWWYQGRGIQVLPAGCCARYQHQVMACSQSDRAAARSGPWRFQDCGFSPPRAQVPGPQAGGGAGGGERGGGGAPVALGGGPAAAAGARGWGLVRGGVA